METKEDERRAISFGGVPGDHGENGPVWFDALPILQAAKDLGRAMATLAGQLEGAGMAGTTLYAAVADSAKRIIPEIVALRPTVFVRDQR